MPYIVRFTDSERAPITVYDNTSSTDTSLTFPGRNVTGYGQIIAENFLHLLENFAGTNQPVNPIEGQLWYDTRNNVLQVYDGGWRAASNVQKSPTEPNVGTSNVGELWVDTTNQQLRIYTGTQWLLVGPAQSSEDGLRYGPSVEKIDDTDGDTRRVLIFYIADIPVVIFSKDSFTPKISISGFDSIKAGININVPAGSQADQFFGGLLPKLYGTAQNADALNVNGVEIASNKFLRSDVDNTIEGSLSVKSNNGILLGVDSTFEVSTSATVARIYNRTIGSSLDLQVNRSGNPTTVLRVLDNKVGINNEAPDQALDVSGNIGLSGSLIISNTSESTNLNNGSIRTAGGVAISKNLLVGTNLSVTGVAQFTGNIQPEKNAKTVTEGLSDIGSSNRYWNNLYVKNVFAEQITGTLSGDIGGNANTATALKNTTTFQLSGDVISQPVVFNGQTGDPTKIFATSLTANIIKSKDEPAVALGDTRARSKKEDQVLVYRPSAEGTVTSRVSVVAGNFVVGRTYVIESIGTTNFVAIGATANVVGASFVATGVGTGNGVASTVTVSSGLLKENRDTFVGDLGVPIGAILPYAGERAPYGYLLCDGSEVEIEKYPDLWNVIGRTYSSTLFLAGTFVVGRLYKIESIGTTDFRLVGASANTIGLTFTATGPGTGTGTASTTSFIGRGTFRLPDLRGRFALGADNMDNGFTVPTEGGGIADAGGGNIDRVPDVRADIVGQGAGQSAVALTLANLPEHSHNMQNGNKEYAAIRVDTAIDPPAVSGLGPTAPGQAQYLRDTGGVKKPDANFRLGQEVGIMNPYLTLNYIIRSGPPTFTTTV